MKAPRFPLRWRWFAAVVVVLIALLVAINIALDWTLPRYLVGKIRADLNRDARLIVDLAGQTAAADLNRAAHDWAKHTGLRVTIIAKDGVVLAESDRPADQLSQIENHIDRPEVQSALESETGSAQRHSDTVGIDLLYVAVRDADRIIRVAIPLYEIAEITRHVRKTVGLASLIVGLFVLPVIYWLARRISDPIDDMRRMATHVAAGDFTGRAPEYVVGEVGELAGALNQMSTQLETRLAELTSEKAHLTGILAGMTEGVLVVDAAGKIRLMNAALREAFVLTDDAFGKTVLEVFRHAGLADLTAGARELTFLQPSERSFTVQIGRLTGETGAVLVFHDITRLKQLENVRKDFVANVSHELRTPLSIIKGYIETLLDEQPPDAATSRQFLETIQRHSRRLESLVEDLLSISALESQQARLDFNPVNLHNVATAVIEELHDRALSRQVGVYLEISTTFPAVRADAQRLHQVLVNLLDNAIKYTPAGSKVRLNAGVANGTATVSVADNGPGIAAEHLPRIFERFYRVDKARSRELGGTGLGLAIVKHIVLAHGGRVWAESETGQGSVFHFTLPLA